MKGYAKIFRSFCHALAAVLGRNVLCSITNLPLPPPKKKVQTHDSEIFEIELLKATKESVGKIKKRVRNRV